MAARYKKFKKTPDPSKKKRRKMKKGSSNATSLKKGHDEPVESDSSFESEFEEEEEESEYTSDNSSDELDQRNRKKEKRMKELDKANFEAGYDEQDTEEQPSQNLDRTHDQLVGDRIHAIEDPNDDNVDNLF